MKPEIDTLEDTILLKKDNVLVDNKTNIICLKYVSLRFLKKTIFSFAGISFISLFFLNNHVSFEQQIKFVSTRDFAGSLCISIGLFMILSILNDIVTTAKKREILSQKFSSVWIPIKFAVISSFLIPFDGTTSVATQMMIETIKILNKLI